MSQVVVIGGNYAGVIAAKKLVAKGFEVKLISPTDGSYSSPIVPRLLSEPNLAKPNYSIRYEKIFKGLKVQHIKALVTQLDPKKQVLTLDNGETLSYKYLVIASGTSHANELFKPSGNTSIDSTINLIEATSKKISQATKIAVVGGGATGVEVSGDIIHYHPTKSVTLFSGNKYPLSQLSESKQQQAQKMLTAKGVKVINNKQVKFDDHQVDGESFDLVISTVGVKPNSSFIPKNLLNERGFLIVDEFLAVPEYPNILAMGDITSSSNLTIVSIVYGQLKTFEQSVDKYFSGKSIKPKPFNGVATTTVIPIGKDGGIGVLFGWGIPSFLVKVLKAKDFMMSKMPNYYDEF